MSNDKTKFQIGALCFAKDFANSWYKSKIVDLDAPNDRVKVHFLGWNSRYDQWFDIESGDIKFNDENVKSETRHKPVTENSSNKSKQVKSVKPEIPSVVSSSTAADIKYSIGTKIAAKWIDENFYPAQVIRHVMKMSILYYEVKFFDGVKKLVRFNNTRDVTGEELALYYPPSSTETNQPNATNQASEATSTNMITLEATQEENRRVEAELLLGIQQPHIIKEETTNVVDSKTNETPQPVQLVEPTVSKTETPNDSNLRKSSRVKRLKTFKDEFVYYSSSTIGFNNSEQDTFSSTSNSKKRKSVSDISKDDKKANEFETKKEDKTSDLALVEEPTSKESSSSNKKNLMQLRLKAFKSKDKKRSLKENLQNTQIRISKLQEKMDKKSKEEKKERIQKLIETNRMALKWQQELIEKHLRQHQHMKLKKKMLKMLRKQNKQKQQLIKMTQFQPTTQVDPLDDFKYEDLIRCNFSNCDKTFRKQSLLEYHLKYHHYVDVNLFTNNDSSQHFSVQQINTLKLSASNKRSAKANTSVKINESNGAKNLNEKLIDSEEDLFDNHEHTDEDPYDVIHCKCGNNKSDGFMIQCEVCLCWQHRVCLNMNSDEDVPKNHYCWICSEPGNKLKKLKYQSWMQLKSLKSSETSKRKNSTNKSNETSLNALQTVDDSSQPRLRLLNICSKKYYNLNLLMYTLEYQTSLLNRLLKSKDDAKNSLLDDTSLKDQIEKLTVNITHLQSCAMKKFDDFNAKLDELEKSQSNTEENILPRFFNLQELYNQLQSLVYQ